MKRLAPLLFVIFAMFTDLQAQAAFNPQHFSIFDGSGRPVDIEQLVRSITASDVVFLGEFHDDAVGHAMQAEIFKRAVTEIKGQRPVVLSLEMFERDVQIILDEYLAGQISENHFMLSSRPWGNYKTDYRPLVEFAKENRIPVVAANAPRRYVNMVSRGGRTTLDSLSKTAKSYLAPLPYAEASEAYAKKFKALMGPSGEAQMGIDNILSSQSLWDATMAYWISRSLKKHDDALVIHLNGGFHTESRLGTVEHLLKYRPKTKASVITIRYEKDFRKFDADKHTGLGDFVVLTDAAQPRSKR
jgi:uncharacterized iron-regulated protein